MEIKLDLLKESIDLLKAKQYDDRHLTAYIFEDGAEYNLTGCTIKINASNYLGQAIVQTSNISISGNKIEADLIRDITRVSGVVKLEYLISKAGKQVTTFTICLDVKQSVLEGANVQPDIVVDVIEILTTKIAEAVKCKEETEQLIKSGNAATKGDIATINSHLDNNVQKIEELTKNPNAYKGAIVTFIDDDARDRLRDTWIPICREKGINITVAVITDLVDTSIYMSKQELLDLQTQGWDFVSHTATHIPTSTVTPEQAEVEYPKAKKWLKDNGFKGYDYLVYPAGLHTERLDIKGVARKYYKYAVATIAGGRYNVAPVDSWRVPRIDGDSDTLTAMKKSVDDAILNNGWVIIMTHSHVICDGDRVQKIKDFIDYTKSVNVPIMTFSEACKLKGNAIALGEFTDDKSTFIGIEGNIKAKKEVIFPLTGKNVMDKLITDYPVNSITEEYLEKSYDTFSNTGGVMKVYRPNNDFYGYREFKKWNDTTIFISNWNYATNNWNDFKAQNIVETGTWTPTLEGLTTVGSNTYVAQTGRYTKIGNMVYATFYIRILANNIDSALSGNLAIGGLPIRGISGEDRDVNTVDYNIINLGTNYTTVLAQVVTDKIYLYKSGNNVPTLQLAKTTIPTDQVCILRGQVSYRCE